MEEIIRIKDKRRGVFTVDNIVLNGYGKALRATGIAFYVILCRYANRETQQAFPSITLIQKETGMDRATILEVAKRVQGLGLVRIKAIPGKYTIYTLLEPKRKHWFENITGSKTSTTGSISVPLVRFPKRTNEKERMKITGNLIKKIRKTHSFFTTLNDTLTRTKVRGF